MRLRIAALALALSALAVTLSAQVRSGTVEISPFYGYLFGGSFPAGSTSQFPDIRAHVADHGTYGVGIGYFLSSALEIESRWARTETDFVDRHHSDGTLHHDGDGRRIADLKIDYFLGYVTYNFGHRRWVPYATIGMGAARLDPGMRNDNACVLSFPPSPPCSDPEPFTRYTAALGAGVKFYASPHVGFRLDGRGYGTYLNSRGDCDSSSHGSGRCSSNWLGNFESSAGLLISF
jgi:opacity protein-like surface antigen